MRSKMTSIKFKKNATYFCQCIHCFDYYFEKKRTNTLHIRMNGHRSSFKIENYETSALANHVHDKHMEFIGDKLKNFKVGIVKQTSTCNLDGAEDLYIWSTNANILHLNWYK